MRNCMIMILLALCVPMLVQAQSADTLGRLPLKPRFLYDVDAFFIVDGIVRWIDLAKLL